jgi:hypothetical protein
MGTRSNIIVKQANGKWKCIYCHLDGYISGAGATLLAHYNSQELADALVEPGDLFYLAPDCSKPEGYISNTRIPGYCFYFGRDRGDPNSDGLTGDTLAEMWPKEDSWVEFVYVWAGKWGVADPDDKTMTLIPLEYAVQADAQGENPIKSLIKIPWGMLAKRT